MDETLTWIQMWELSVDCSGCLLVHYTLGSPLGFKAQTLSPCDPQFSLQHRARLLHPVWHVTSLALETVPVPVPVPDWTQELSLG